MSAAEQLLERLVVAEEQGAAHWSSCEHCKGRQYCPEGKRLLKESVAATLAAKIHVDRARGRIAVPS